MKSWSVSNKFAMEPVVHAGKASQRESPCAMPVLPKRKRSVRNKKKKGVDTVPHIDLNNSLLRRLSRMNVTLS
jgi:hypothetical protein